MLIKNHIRTLCLFFILCSQHVLADTQTHFSAGSGTVMDPYQITTCAQLQQMSDVLYASYTLASDIYCGESREWNDGKGFIPVGTRAKPFLGSLQGQGHKIYDLYIHSDTQDVGLFGYVDHQGQGQGVIENVNLVNVEVNRDIARSKHVLKAQDDPDPGESTGTLVGFNKGSLSNDTVSGNIEANANRTSVGGLVGFNNGSLANVGAAVDLTDPGTSAGGLVGSDGEYATISNAYATGNITSTALHVGGLVGVESGVENNTYASGNVSGKQYVGGLVGQTYSTIGASGISNAYSSGHVSGDTDVGGLIGDFTTQVPLSNSYYDTDTSGQSDTGRGTPLHTKDMFAQASFSGWDFTNTWSIANGHDYPQLKWQAARPFNIHVTGIASTETIDKPFPISIVANNPNFNGRVDIGSERGDVTPSYVTLQNGVWSGNITLGNIGKHNRLLLKWTPQYSEDLGQSYSTYFDVNSQSGTIPANAEITGIVTNDDDTPLSGVTVNGYLMGSTKIAFTTKTDINGKFDVAALMAGSYKVKFQLSQYQDRTISVELIVAGKTTLSPYLSSSSCDHSKVPVLLLPGIMGSTSTAERYEGRDIYPQLPARTPEYQEKALALYEPHDKLVFGNGVVGWADLTQALKKQGYVRGCDLFKVPYDWTLSIPQIRDTYLIHAISEAEKKSHQNKVDIIAHSMGGLVARSYIQSPFYNHDVSKLAIVGTPNEGSASAYFLWEAGSADVTDKAVGDTEGKSFLGVGKYFYSNTINHLMKNRGWGKACNISFNFYPSNCKDEKIYAYLNTFEHGMALGALMPIYNAAIVDDKGTGLPIKEEENSFLKALNSVSCLNDSQGKCRNRKGDEYVFNPVSSLLTADSSGVETKLFYADNKDSTPQSIIVGPGLRKLYKDGRPITITPNKSSGDGTVLTTSILSQYLPSNLPQYTDPGKKGVDHSNLIKNYVSNIVSFITGTSGISGIKDDPTSPSLLINITGQVSPSLAVSSNGKRLNSKDIQETDYYNLHESSIEVASPVNGSYTLNLKAPYAGNVEISITYVDPSQPSKTYTAYFDDTMADASEQNYVFNIDSTATNIVSLSRQFLAPEKLSLSNTNNLVSVAWQDSTGDSNKDVDHYEVYARADNSPAYSLLGTTTDKTFTTKQPWSDVGSYEYAVKAVLKNGSKTVFSSSTIYIPPIDAK